MTTTRPLVGAPPPSVSLPRPYASSEDHLRHELERIDHLVRAHVIRWRAGLGAAKPPELWGMLVVTDAEVDAFLRAPFFLGGQPPIEAQRAIGEQLARATAAEETIDQRRAATEGLPLRVDALRRAFGLSRAELDAVLLCLLAQLDARYRRLFGYLADNAAEPLPPVELLLDILGLGAAGRPLFNAERPLRRWSLATLVSPPPEAPLPNQGVRLDERIAGFLLGDDAVDGRLTGLVAEARTDVSWDRLVLDDARITGLRSLAATWTADSGRPVLVLLHGPEGSGRLTSVRAICTASGTPLLVADAPAALRSGLSWDLAVRLVHREAQLRGAALHWAGAESLLDEDGGAGHLDALLAAAAQSSCPTVLASTTGWDPTGRLGRRPVLRLALASPSYEQRRTLWEATLPPGEDFAEPVPDVLLLAEALANAFQLTGGQIADAVRDARARAGLRGPGHDLLEVEDLYEACRGQSTRRLPTFARRVRPRATASMDDLVLPAAHRRQFDELRARIRDHNRVYSGLGFEQRISLGKGLIALLTGPSGTGKTMAAELLAQEQGVDLYKVDLAAVVSKYVGETEKNLSRVFADAEDASAILFFDEADALFGRRGEVNDARDRWANLEINFLLQRIEEYSGVVILASNLRQNIDAAFARRINIILDFVNPDADARARIWAGIFPQHLERPPDSDLRDLAGRFPLTGGNIRNVVLDAAFRAVRENPTTPRITVEHLVLATAREYQKLDRPITAGEFGREHYGLIEKCLLADPGLDPLRV